MPLKPKPPGLAEAPAAMFVPHKAARPEKSEGGRRFKVVTDMTPKGDQPAAIKELVKGILNNDRDQVLLGSALTPLSQWSTPIPAETRALTVLVHGFNVNRQQATEEFFPTYFKRLYWTGLPVMAAQDHAHVVGIDWPGNQHQTALSRLAGLPIPLIGSPGRVPSCQDG